MQSPHVVRAYFPDGLRRLGLFLLEDFSPSFQFADLSTERFSVSIFHVSSRCGGNYNYLVSNTVLLLPIYSVILVLAQHRADPCSSLPLLLFRFFLSWLDNFVI